MKKSGPVQVAVHAPNTEEGRLALARKAASLHADAVNKQIQQLRCSAEQKHRLLDAVIEAAGKQTGAQTE